MAPKPLSEVRVFVKRAKDSFKASKRPGPRSKRGRARHRSSFDAEDIDRWLDHKEAATKHLAHQDYARAAASLKAAQEVSERAIEALNRETAMARTVLDTCLYVVRGLWETGKTAQAEEQARKCRRLVPQIQPTMTLHTPTVRSIIEQIDRERQEQAAATLEVKSPQQGCLVRLNGLHLGTTPFMMAELIPGEYRVQVECDKDRPGRVHRIDLHDDATLWIDPTLDDAVRTEPEVHLVYPSEDAFSQNGTRHAQGLARMLDVTTVILVAPFEMARVDRAFGAVGSVPLRADTSALSAVDALLRIDPSATDAPRAKRGGSPDGGSGARRHKIRKAVGGTLAGGGAVSLAVAAGLYARRVNKGNEFSRDGPRNARVRNRRVRSGRMRVSVCCSRRRWAPSFWPPERHSPTRRVAVCPGGAGPSARSGSGS